MQQAPETQKGQQAISLRPLWSSAAFGWAMQFHAFFFLALFLGAGLISAALTV